MFLFKLLKSSISLTSLRVYHILDFLDPCTCKYLMIQKQWDTCKSLKIIYNFMDSWIYITTAQSTHPKESLQNGFDKVYFMKAGFLSSHIVPGAGIKCLHVSFFSFFFFFVFISFVVCSRGPYDDYLQGYIHSRTWEN